MGKPGQLALTDLERGLLNENLKDAGEPFLPVKWSQLKNKSFVLQVRKVRNVLQPKSYADFSSNLFLYRVDLTDGKGEVIGLVDQPVRGISADTPSGSKVRITCPVECEGNFLFLNASNTVFLGGSAGKSVKPAWDADKGAAASKSAVGPPKWVPFGVKMDDAHLAVEELASMNLRAK